MVGVKGKSGGDRSGAGRPSKMDKKKTKSLKVSLKSHDDIAEIAKKTKKPQAEIFEKLMDYGNKNIDLFE